MALAALDPEDKMFVIYIASVVGLVYLNWEALIVGLEIEVVIVIMENLDLANVFFWLYSGAFKACWYQQLFY